MRKSDLPVYRNKTQQSAATSNKVNDKIHGEIKTQALITEKRTTENTIKRITGSTDVDAHIVGTGKWLQVYFRRNWSRNGRNHIHHPPSSQTGMDC